MYTHPGESVALPTDTDLAADLFVASPLAERLGTIFSRSFANMAHHEAALAAEHAPDPDVVSDWERARYLAHT